MQINAASVPTKLSPAPCVDSTSTFIPGSEKIYDADVVIVAFGFRASPASWFNDFNIETKKNGLVIAEEEQKYKFQTSNNKIFSGGDMVRGSDLVVTAIWEGREAGKSIIKYVS